MFFFLPVGSVRLRASTLHFPQASGKYMSDWDVLYTCRYHQMHTFPKVGGVHTRTVEHSTCDSNSLSILH